MIGPLILSVILINTCQSKVASYKEVDLPDVGEDTLAGTSLRGPICPSKCEFVMIDHYGTYLKQVLQVNKSSGALILRESIDRERLVSSSMCEQDDCVLKFSIVDRLSNQMEGIRVRIIDVNDNRPMFKQDSYEIHISENIPIGYREPLPMALDADHGCNSKISYYLFDYDTENSHTFSFSNLFGLVQDPPSLEVLGNLDYEQQQSYKFRLKAVDGGIPSHSSEILLSVIVDDVNDNIPQCVPDVQSASIAEDAEPGSFVGRIIAIDRDSPRFGSLIYAIQVITPPNQSGMFRIDSSDGSIYLADRLDYENVKKYSLKVKVLEQSAGWFPIICSFEVNVLDVNDNAPRIDVSFADYNISEDGRIQISIEENVPTGHAIGDMIITDNDGSNENCHWEMKFECGALKAVEIEDGSKFILVSVEVDREQRDRYECSIEAVDKAPPYFKTVFNFIVLVLDVNDNAPKTNFPNRIEFKENTAVGAVIAVLNSTDADSNSNMVYSLAESSSDFKLSPRGQLMTLRPFDREMGDSCFTIMVNVSDRGTPVLTTQNSVKLCVTDVNDNRPKFDMRSYTFKVAEDTPIGAIIGQVNAEDKDSGDNGRFEFNFCPPKRNSKPHYIDLPFAVDKNGTIRLVQCLDYEFVSSYEVDICVRDFGEPRVLADKSRISFLIQNKNDNCPKFLSNDMVHYINRDMANADYRFDFLVEDLDGEIVEVLASLVPYWQQFVKVNLIKTFGNHHQFELSLGDAAPRPGFYAIRLIARDIPQNINDISCNTTAFVIFAIGTNSTNRTECIQIAERSLKHYRTPSEARIGIKHLTRYRYFYLFSILALLLLLLSLAIAIYSGRLRSFVESVNEKRGPKDSSLYFITSQVPNGYDSNCLPTRSISINDNQSTDQKFRDSGYESTEIRSVLKSKQTPRAWPPLNHALQSTSREDKIEISL